MQEMKARELLRKYKEGTLTDDEKVLLESWYLAYARSKNLDAKKEDLENYLSRVKPPSVAQKREINFPFLRLAAAASLVFILGIFIFRWVKPDEITTEATYHALEDIPPGDNRARLTLANGSSIFLEKASNGVLVKEGNLEIIKTHDGEIVYNLVHKNPENSATLAYNKIETPKAGQYQVVLPDGTRAWLNAASSIRFPSVFPKNQRFVEITGEVFFEVAKLTNGKKPVPFTVQTYHQEIDVLGTVFNVNSYKDEDAIKTTLIEGSIQIKMRTNPKQNVILKPGQQAQLITKTEISRSEKSDIKVLNVDTGPATAWKEGYFSFDGVSLPELMRQLARWYNMEVIYENPVSDFEFVGRIERSTQLSNVLKVLELGGVKFRVEKNKIIVNG